MSRYVKQFVMQCDLCQRVKYSNLKIECQFRLVESNEPSDLMCVDFYGPLPRSTAGVEYIFVILDAFLKYVKLYPLKKADTKTVLRKLVELYFPEMGKPQRMLADHGSKFTSPKWRNKLNVLGVKVIHSSIRHPKSNPVERVPIKECIKISIN